MSLLGGIIVLIVLLSVSFIPDMGDAAPHVLRIIGISIGSFLFILGVPKIIGGLALMKHQEWARILVIILSCLSMLNIPLGTALGIYSLVYLTKPEMTELFKPKTV